MLAAGAPPGEGWRWFAFFFILFYVDDGGIACFDDLLYDHHGQPVLEIVLDKDGRQMRDHNQALVLRHQSRPSMYADAAKKLSRRWGHDTPWKKFVSETLFLVYSASASMSRGSSGCSRTTSGSHTRMTLTWSRSRTSARPMGCWYTSEITLTP